MYSIEWQAELGSLLGPVPGNSWLNQNHFVAFQNPRNDLLLPWPVVSLLIQTSFSLLHCMQSITQSFEIIQFWFISLFLIVKTQSKMELKRLSLILPSCFHLQPQEKTHSRKLLLFQGVAFIHKELREIRHIYVGIITVQASEYQLSYESIRQIP